VWSKESPGAVIEDQEKETEEEGEAMNIQKSKKKTKKKKRTTPCSHQRNADLVNVHRDIGENTGCLEEAYNYLVCFC